MFERRKPKEGRIRKDRENHFKDALFLANSEARRGGFRSPGEPGLEEVGQPDASGGAPGWPRRGKAGAEVKVG